MDGMKLHSPGNSISKEICPAPFDPFHLCQAAGPPATLPRIALFQAPIAGFQDHGDYFGQTVPHIPE